MIKTNAFPLRSVKGSAIPVANIRLFQTETNDLTIVTRYHNDIRATVQDPIYSEFLPDLIQLGARYKPLAGMNTMPIPDSNSTPFGTLPQTGFLNILRNPSDNPFQDDDPVVSIFGYNQNLLDLELNSQEIGEPERINHLCSGQDKNYSFLILLQREVLNN
jgi:hypothetical protein